MSDSVWTARSANEEVARAAVGRVDLPMTAEGRYNFDDADIYRKGVTRALRSMLNPGNPTGMAGLFDGPRSELGKIKSTDSITWQQVLADEARRVKRANAAKAPDDPEVTATIVDRADANDEANRINANVQAVIGAKIGATEAIVKTVGKGVTDSVLRLPDGSDVKDVDEYQLKDLMDAVINGASRPLVHDIIQQVYEVVNFRFNMQDKVEINVERLRTKLGKAKSYGINLDETIVALVIVHNITYAQNEPWGNEFRTVLQAIRQKYAYNYVHTEASVKDILGMLAPVDAVRNMSAAPAPGSSTFGTANAVATAHEGTEELDAITRLADMLSKGGSLVGSTVETESAAAATSDSDSSRGRSRDRDRRGRGKGKEKKKGGRRDKSKPRAVSNYKDNPCKYCRKFKRTSLHPNVPEAKCMFNKEYKGFRFFSVCERIGEPFRLQEEFPPELGGYPRDE